MVGFPSQQEGVRYLTEGGQETELMYKHGHDLPEFAMYPLLDDPSAVADLERMYRQYFEVANASGFVPLVGGLDYRASPDWAGKLGISIDGLRDYQLRSIAFLRDMAQKYANDPSRVLIVGTLGPRGDAYGENKTITADEAQEYHSVQIATLVEAQVDLVGAMTFNGIPEAVGTSRAAFAAGLPLSMSFMVDTSGRILNGARFSEAIETVDAETGDARPDFYGINCSHPDEFEPAFAPGAWMERVRSLRPNAALMDKQSLCTLGHLEAGDPPQLGRLIAGIAKRYPSIDIFGGCCGTWDDHLRAIASELSA